MLYDQRPGPSFPSFRNEVINQSDPEWRGAIEDNSRESFQPRYKAGIGKIEEEIHVAGASLHTDRVTNEQTESRTEGGKRCYPIDDRFHQLDQLDSSKGIPDTSKFEKLWKPVIEINDSLASTIIPNTQISCTNINVHTDLRTLGLTRQGGDGSEHDATPQSEARQPARLGSVVAREVPQIPSALPIVIQQPKPRRIKTQYNLHEIWKSGSGDFRLWTDSELIHPSPQSYRSVTEDCPPSETNFRPTLIPVEVPDFKLDNVPDELMKRLQSVNGYESCSLLAVLLTDRACHKRLLAWRGEAAQFLLNRLQSHLSLFSPDARIRGLFVGVLIKLSRLSGLYPECLVRGDIRLIGNGPVAAGRFGDVWKGSASSQEIIAVKVLRLYQSDMEKLLKEFSVEAVTWRQLSHPNVLPFYGVFHLNNERSGVCLVSPWMENGNIIQFLQRKPDVDRVPLIFDIAEGLEYLHESRPSIIHGDLKGVNILITPEHTACLADFGLTSVEDSQAVFSASSGRVTGTSRWQAPELLDPQSVGADCRGWTSPASDIFSFACVCYELYSGKVPFHEISNECRVIISVTKGERPSRPGPEQRHIFAGWDLDIWTLIDSCWAQQPAARPTAKEIVTRLRDRTQTHSPRRPLRRQPRENRDPLYFWHSSSDSEPFKDESHRRFLEDKFRELSL